MGNIIYKQFRALLIEEQHQKREEERLQSGINTISIWDIMGRL